MNQAIKDMILAGIKPYLKDCKIVAFYENKPLDKTKVDVVISIGEDVKVFKLDVLERNIQNGEFEIT